MTKEEQAGRDDDDNDVNTVVIAINKPEDWNDTKGMNFITLLICDDKGCVSWTR